MTTSSPSTLTYSATAPVLKRIPGRRAWAAKLARDAMRRQLKGLHGGALNVTDPWGEWQIGDSGGPHTHVQVNDPAFYVDVALEGSLGAARSFMGGAWTSPDLTAVLSLLVRNIALVDSMEGGGAAIASVAARIRHAFRSNTGEGSRRNIHAHYDLGNDLFELFLDPTMTYSAGIYEREDSTLEQAQVAKLDRICRKLDLQPTDHLLEIGTGWGSFSMHAARHYGARVTTTTISAEQHALAEARIRAAGLDDRIEVLLTDYRQLTGQYDKLVSIEMIEAVGHKFLPTYFGACSRLLKADGAMLLQGITMPDQRYAQYLKASDFIQEYIFPGSCCPALTAMLDAVRTASDMRVGHVEDIGLHYARTLREWRERFDAREAEVRALGYPDEFIRMWRYYLCYCEAGFAERYTGDVQLLLEKPGCRARAVLGDLTTPTGLGA